MVFKRNKKYFSSLKEEKEGYWVSEQPLFIGGNKGLFPVFKNGGPTGQFPKNHQEYILKPYIKPGIVKPIPGNKNAENVLNFDEKQHYKGDADELLKGL
tara:strand:+ start:4736 stop:5032 length:297 start_codon:yes stop_codon:yes gene_type:complete